ncbi:MAG: helix-hairpin-helix domain-containing protein [Gammaproteobacteria bacterium]
MRTSGKFLATILITTPMFVFANADPLVNPNRAGVQEMQDDLIGVTEGQAKDIVQYRNEHGQFESKKELTRVQGVGWDDININRNYLYLGEEPERQQVSG